MRQPSQISDARRTPVVLDSRISLLGLLAVDMLFIAIGTVTALAFQPTHVLVIFLSLEGEATIPSWYSSIKFSALALLFALYARWPWNSVRNLIAIGGAVLFLAMSADEVVGIHERLQLIVAYNLPDSWLETAQTNTIYLAGWIVVLPVAALVSIFIYLAFRFLKWGRQSRLFILGFALLLAGAVVFDLWEELQGFSDRQEIFSTMFEETLEFIGVSCMIAAAFGAFLRSRGDETSDIRAPSRR